MLDVAIIFTLMLWFIVIPTVVEMIAWFKKKKSVSDFFKYSMSCKLCVISMSVMVASLDISIGYSIPSNKTLLRVYTILSILLFAGWESYKHYKLYNYQKDLSSNDNMILSIIVGKFFGPEKGYNIFKCEHNDMITKNIWEYLRSCIEIRNVPEDVLQRFKDYVLDVERKALNKKDAELLSEVIKAKLEYFNEDNIALKYYKSAANEYSEIEEQKIIHEIITSNSRMFKML